MCVVLLYILITCIWQVHPFCKFLKCLYTCIHLCRRERGNIKESYRMGYNKRKARVCASIQWESSWKYRTISSESSIPLDFPVLAEKSLEVTNEEQKFVWKGCGLRLHIPHNSLPDDCSHCHLKIAVSLSRHFELPEDGVLVSAVYSFTHDLGDRELKNPVTLEIQHCATDTVLSGLRFLRANSDSNKLEIIQGGDFQPGYAVIDIDHFSSIGLWLQNQFYFTFHFLDYRAKLYYTDIQHLSFKASFYILPNLDANFKVWLCIMYI